MTEVRDLAPGEPYRPDREGKDGLDVYVTFEGTALHLMWLKEDGKWLGHLQAGNFYRQFVRVPQMDCIKLEEMWFGIGEVMRQRGPWFQAAVRARDAFTRREALEMAREMAEEELNTPVEYNGEDLPF